MRLIIHVLKKLGEGKKLQKTLFWMVIISKLVDNLKILSKKIVNLIKGQ